MDPYWNSCSGGICTHVDIPDHSQETYVLIFLIVGVFIFLYIVVRKVKGLMTTDSSTRFE